MDPQRIAARITDFFNESYPHDGMALEPTTDLLNGWFVDSLGIIMTVAFLEKSFGIDVQSADVNAENFFSIETLTRYVSLRLARA